MQRAVADVVATHSSRCAARAASTRAPRSPCAGSCDRRAQDTRVPAMRPLPALWHSAAHGSPSVACVGCKLRRRPLQGKKCRRGYPGRWWGHAPSRVATAVEISKKIISKSDLQ